MLETIPGIVVEVGLGLQDIEAHWRDLTSRASANVFMSPSFIGAAAATLAVRTLLLTAWERTARVDRLVGVWGLRRSRSWRFGPRVLSGPLNDFSFVSSPVVDRSRIDDVVPAFLDAIADDPSLPKIVRLRYLDGGSETNPAIMKALAARGSRGVVLAERERAFATRAAGVKPSGSTRKKLRQSWNRLSAEGAVEIVNDRRPAAVTAGLEVFLKLEAGSWRGRTAMLADAATAAFARKAISDLADASAASVAILQIDGRPIATQVLLYSGRTGYTWKTAFDPEYGRYSPGALLVDKITAELLSTGEIDAIESCSPEGGFMEEVWSGRRATIDLLIDLGRSRSVAFPLVEWQARARARLKAARDSLGRSGLLQS
jgi:CelD/BcsL family acetyltransferase involved in cellulose biosynthesis